MASPKKNNKNKKKATSNKKKAVSNAPKKVVKAKQNKKTPKKDSNRTYLAIASLVLAIVTFWVYQGALDNDFVDWDDFAYVVENDLVRATNDMAEFTAIKGNKNRTISSTVGEYTTSFGDVFSRVVSLNYHPLTMLTMRWNNNACPTCSQGISARPFILWNIILHILNSILVLLLIYWMSKKNLLASIVVAAIFALHPMHVESVAWVSERKDVLYTFFFLSGLLAYSQYLAKASNKWLAIALGLFILSCLSKAMAVVFPLAMILLYYWDDKSKDGITSLKNTLKPSALLHTLPFFAISIFFGAMASNVQSGGDFGGWLTVTSSSVAINSFDTFSILQRFQFACYGFLEYIIRFFLPTSLCTFYPYPDQPTYDASLFFKAAPFIVLAILSIAVVSIKYTKSIATGIGFYLVTVILVLQFVSVGAVIMADRYTYLPYIGFAFMLVMLVQEFAPKKAHEVIYAAMLVFTLFLTTKTISQIETWQDSESLWTNVIELHKLDGNILQQNMEQPLSIRGNFYGKQSEKASDEKQRLDLINKAFQDFEKAAKLGSKRPDIYEGMGNTHGMRGNYTEALKNYSIALELDPKKGTTYFNRGVTNSLLRDHQNAVKDYTLAIQHAPQQAPMAHVNRGISYVELGQRENAIADFQKALQYNPNHEIAQRYMKQLTGN